MRRPKIGFDTRAGRATEHAEHRGGDKASEDKNRDRTGVAISEARSVYRLLDSIGRIDGKGCCLSHGGNTP